MQSGASVGRVINSFLLYFAFSIKFLAPLSNLTLRSLSQEENQIRAVGRDERASKLEFIKESLVRADPKFGALLRVPLDPCESHCPSIPIVPEPSITFGGELGQWGERHESDRLGPILDATTRSDEDSRAILNIHVRKLVLEEHPLLIEEERLAVQLKHLYSQYRLLYQNNAIFYLVSRLKTVIESLSRLVEIGDGEYTEENTIAYLIGDIIESLPALCSLKDCANNLTTRVYGTWRTIKEKRDSQRFSSTSVILRAIPIKQETESTRSPRRGDDNSKEDDDASQVSSIAEMDSIWSHICGVLLPNLPDLIAKARAMVQSSDSKGETDGGEADEGMSRQSSEKMLIEQRKKDDLKSDGILKECISLLSSKSEQRRGIVPDFVFQLTDDGPITTDNACVPDEAARRKAISALKIKARLVMSNLAASAHQSSTDYVNVSFPGFELDFNHIFQISLLHEPTRVHLELYASSAWGADLLCASVVTPLPGQRQTNETSINAANFKHQPVTSSYTPIASNYAFSSEGLFRISSGPLGGKGLSMLAHSDNKMGSRICGNIFVITEFEMLTSGKANDGIRTDDLARVPRTSLEALRKGVGMRSTTFAQEKDFLKLMPKFGELDINDPRNEGLLSMLLAAGGVVSGRNLILSSSFADNKEYFRLFHDESALLLTENGQSYANYMKFQQGLRIKLLQLRTKKPYLFSGPVPLNEAVLKHSDIYKNLIQAAYPGDQENGRIIIDQTPMEAMGSIAGDSDISSQFEGDTGRSRRKVSDFLNRVKEGRQLNAKKSKRFFMTSHVISEVDVNPYWDWIHFWSLAWLIPERLRRLKPSSEHRLPQIIQVRKCDMLIQIVAAKNIPGKIKNGVDAPKSVSPSKRTRSRRRRGGIDKDSDEEDGFDVEDDEDEMTTSRDASVRTFVEVRFQESSARTSTVIGSAPIWKQTLKLPFKAPQDRFSPIDIEQVRDEVHIGIFDEISRIDPGGVMDDGPTERLEKRYLGSVNIPFATVAKEGKIEGVFRVSTPPFIWGYGTKSVPVQIEEQMALSPAPVNSILNCFGFLVPAEDQNGSGFANTGLDDVVESELDYYASSNNSMFVRLMITLDPLIMHSEKQKADDEISSSHMSFQDRYMVGYAHKYLQVLASFFRVDSPHKH